MSTLCTQATRFSWANGNPQSKCAETPLHTAGTGSSVKAVFEKLGKTITQFIVIRYNQRIDRQAFKNVLALDDRILKDIGVSRQDVKWASRLPLAEDAAIKLEQIARRRKY